MKEPSPENTCKTFAEHISAYVDGQLTGELLETVEKHLRECPHCARQLEHYTLFKNLMNTERQNCPVDLTSVVMAGLERDHLLQGLETLSKPPTPRWVKLVRAFSAAAMLALIASAGLIIMHFTGNTQKTSLSINHTPPVATRGLEVAKQNAKPHRELAFDAPAEENQHKAPAPPPAIVKELKDTSQSDALTKQLPSKDRTFSSPSAGLGGVHENYTEEIGITKIRSADKKLDIRSNAPLTLRPSPAHESRISQKLIAPKSLSRAWPVELVYELNSSDLPGWMLLKEQVIIALMENDIPSLSESWQVVDALEKGDEFFYLAKKGLDLPPGSRRAQILLITHPQTFARIHASLQQAMSETIRQQLSPELDNYLRSKTISPELMIRTQSTFASLDSAFGVATARPAFVVTSQATQPTTRPTTTQATIIAVLSTSSAPATQPTASAPTTTPSKVVSTRPNLTQFAVLIKIEIAKPTPTTTTTTAPTTQATMPSVSK